MIKFAVKSLVVLVLVGHAIKLVEPEEPVAGNPRFTPAAYAESRALSEPGVHRNLSTFTNAQIVVSHAARDAAGFCDREPLACQSGRELMIRLATGIRDLAAGVADWTKEDESRHAAAARDGGEDEYRPLENYRGPYPILPEAPPARSDTL